MKVKVISVFRDKFTGKYYTPGEVIEVGEETRVLDMESRRLVERVEVKTPEVKTTEEKKEVKISLFEKEFEKKTLIEALKSIGVQASGNMKEETAIQGKQISVPKCPFRYVFKSKYLTHYSYTAYSKLVTPY